MWERERQRQRDTNRPGEARNGYQISWSWSCRQLWAAQYGFWESQSSRRGLSILNHWALSPTLICFSRTSVFSWVNCGILNLAVRWYYQREWWPVLTTGLVCREAILPLLQFISEMTREEPGVLCNINSYLFMKCLPLENNVGEAGQFLAQRVHTLLQEDDLM